MEHYKTNASLMCLKKASRLEIIQSNYAGFFVIGLVLIILCAWFSEGYHSADEHFQIFEFVNYKFGKSPKEELPWEFHAQLRATILPTIAFIFGKMMDFLGCYNPFILAFLLRLCTGIASWYVYSKFCLLLLPKFNTEKGKQLFIISCMFLWFIPYLSVRFTPENISGLLMLSGMYSIFCLDRNALSLSKIMLSGIFFGASFFIRPQMAAAIAGFVFWLIVIDKMPFKKLAGLILTILIPLLLFTCVDAWFYGEWTCTPYNYFHANIVQHKAAEFGIKSWWYYFYQLIAKSAPPMSILLFAMFLVGVYKNPKDAFVFTILPFVFLHLLIGHKELRFLFPVMYLYIYLFSLGFDYVISNKGFFNIHNWYEKILILCIPLLIARSFLPSGGGIEHYRYLYDKIPSKNTVFFHLEDALAFNFYNKQYIKTIFIKDVQQLKNYLQAERPQNAFFISEELFDLKVDRYEIKKLYSPALFFIFQKPTIYSFHRLVT